MNGEHFYEDFKEALRFFDVPWHDKEKVKITGVNGFVVVSYQDSEVRIATSELPAPGGPVDRG